MLVLEKKNWDTCRMASSHVIGPALQRLLDVQEAEDEAVSWRLLGGHAAALVAVCSRLAGPDGWPVVWPVGRGAERLVGAATVVGGPHLRPLSWAGRLDGQRVLLVVVNSLSALPLAQAATHARALGVTEVLACGAMVEGLPGPLPEGVAAYFPLNAYSTTDRRIA
jgi:hypothetical protein